MDLDVTVPLAGLGVSNSEHRLEPLALLRVAGRESAETTWLSSPSRVRLDDEKIAQDIAQAVV